MATNQTGEKNIRKWWGGISDDVREQTVTEFALSKHFDTVQSPNSLIPYRNTVADEDTTFLIRNFLYAQTNFYGLGRTTADTKTKIYYKNATPIPGTWTAATSGEAANNDTTYFDSFGQYKNFLWGIRTGFIWKYEINVAFTQNFLTLGETVLTVAPSVVHPIADRLFLFYNARVAQIDNGTGTDAVLVLPSNMKITSACAFGDSLAIACVGKSNVGLPFSRVYLWNMIDPTPYQMIDWGQENLNVLEVIDNQLVGISITGDSDFSFNQTLFVKTWNGGDVTKVKEIMLDAADYTLGIQKFVSQNSLYFLVTGTTQTYTGVWRVGRKNEGYPFQVTIDRKIDNDATVTSAQGLYILGDYVWVAHSNNGSVDRTSSSATYTATSFVQTQRYNGDDPSQRKQLRGVALSYEALPAAGAPVLKYRKDEETSFTTIFTETTDSSMATQRTAIATTTMLPDFYEIQFQVESTGGAKITGLRFIYDYLGSPMD